MKVEDYYYHTINKDSENIELIYDNFKEILKLGGLKSKNIINVSNDKITMNGDHYISLASYTPKSKYKVPQIPKKYFVKSNLLQIYSTYDEYIKFLEQNSLPEGFYSKEIFFKKKNTNNIREYYRYLDSIARLFPIDLKWFFGNNIYSDEIVRYIYKKSTIDSKYKDVGYFYANENAYDKYIKNGNGITFVISKDINCENCILIPNLPDDFFDTSMQLKIANSIEKRYTNLIGEVQIKDEVDIENIVGIILNKDININKVQEIMKSYNINIPIVKIANVKA